MPQQHQPPLHAQLAAGLQTRHNLVVNPAWLTAFLAARGQQTLPPFPALLSTLHFRILASDITTSLAPSGDAEADMATKLLPARVDDVNVKERRLEGPVVVQVLDVLDVGTSKWSQVEAIERVERGEEVRGREVIRNVGVDENTGGAAAAGPGGPGTRPATAAVTTPAASASSNSSKLSSGPHRILLQDAKGTKVLAFELVKVPKIALSIAASASASTGTPLPQQQQDDPGMFIGCKLSLRSRTVVRRGMVMLTPENCVVLGGKVEVWDKKWKEERKQRLMNLVVEEHVAASASAGSG